MTVNLESVPCLKAPRVSGDNNVRQGCIVAPFLLDDPTSGPNFVGSIKALWKMVADAAPASNI